MMKWDGRNPHLNGGNDNMTYRELCKFLKTHVSSGFIEYRRVHKVGNEEEWDEEGEFDMYKQVFVDNVSDVLEDIELHTCSLSG